MTSSAIMTQQRLASRRGAPLVVYSDNGTNFRGASKELKAEIEKIDRETLKGLAMRQCVNWQLNPPDAPFMGMAWERLVRSVKVPLAVSLEDKAPSEEVLHTVLVETTRLTLGHLRKVSLDVRDDEALTLNHFLSVVQPSTTGCILSLEHVPQKVVETRA